MQRLYIKENLIVDNAHAVAKVGDCSIYTAYEVEEKIKKIKDELTNAYIQCGQMLGIAPKQGLLDFSRKIQQIISEELELK